MVRGMASKLVTVVGVWMMLGEVFGALQEVESNVKHQALPTKAGQTICTLGKTLKNVAPWLAEKLDETRKKVEKLQGELATWQTKATLNPDEAEKQECGVGEGDETFKSAKGALDTAKKALPDLEKKALLSAATAARSAGRLDEFILIFANAKASSTHYCVGASKSGLTSANLGDCFKSTASRNGFNEENVLGIPEAMDENLGEKITDLTTEIDKIGFEAVKDGDGFFGSGGAGGREGAGCNLVNGAKGGILGGSAIERVLPWGGGVLMIGPKSDGNIQSLAPGKLSEIQGKNSKDGKANWTTKPSADVPHLKEAVAKFTAFKTKLDEITRALTQRNEKMSVCIKNLGIQPAPEPKVDAPGEENSESITPANLSDQTCLDQVTKLAAEVKGKEEKLKHCEKEKESFSTPSQEEHNTSTNNRATPTKSPSVAGATPVHLAGSLVFASL